MRPSLAASGLTRVPALLLAMILGIVTGVLFDPWFGLVAAGLVFALIARPLEAVTALAVLAAAASFVNNEGGRMTRDLAAVTTVGLFALVPLALARMRGKWQAPGGPLVVTLLAFLAWTAVSAARGVLAGHSLKFIGLEVAALGTMAFTWLAGGLRLSARDLRPALVVLLVTGLGHVTLGVASYAVNQVRTGGLWYTPLPGMLAVIALSFGVRARAFRSRLGWTLLFGLFLMHQTISFSRGYWLGLLVALPWTAFMFAGFGPGARARWRRVVGVAALAAVVLAAATMLTALAMGWSALPEMLGTRLSSSFSTDKGSVSASNVARLLEYPASFRRISEQPWLGHGMGLEIRVHEPFRRVVTRQWYVHQTYLWLWLKQGLIGLALFSVLLVQAMRTSLAGARSGDDEQAAWCLGAAGATLFLIVVDFTTYHLANVNSTMLQSLLWGFTLALGRPAHWRLVWRERVTGRGAAALPRG